MSNPLIRQLQREIEAEAFDNLALLASHLVEERGNKLPDVLEAFKAIGESTGEGPDVETQTDVDAFDHVYSFSEWHQFSDGSILSPDGSEALGDESIADEGHQRAQEERDDALLAMHEAREDY